MKSKQSLLILGASGLAMETIELVRLADCLDVIGVLDDDVKKHGSSVLGVPILGSIEEHSSYSESKFINCIASVASPGSRLGISRKLNIGSEQFATLVHPSASISPSVTLGSGSIVLASCVLTADIIVGNHCVLMPFVALTHEDRVSDGVTFGSGVKIAGRVQIGEGAYLGSGVLVRERTKIGEYSVLGIGSVVLEDIPAGQVWIGNPARFLRLI